MLLIGNGRVLTPEKIIDDGAIFIKDNIIDEIGPSSELQKKYPNAEFLDAAGGIIMPGLTNCHMHLYSTFARGMCLEGDSPSNFVEILEGLWWRLDKTLNEDDVFQSARIPLIECIKSGTTTIIDHHASPSFVKGSLNAIKKALTEIPVRASLCYEVSDRDGEKIALDGIEENAGFIKENNNDMLTGLVGMHASFTVSDETVKKCVDAASKLNVGLHVHTSEDKADLDDAMEKYGKGVVERWNDLGVLGEKTLLGHCIYISEEEMDLLANTKTNVVHNPESNMNNAVGCADVAKMLGKGVLVGLGTDGMTADMFQEAKFAHLIRKEFSRDPRVGFMEAGELLFKNNIKILSKYFSKPLGKIEKGALADVIVLDYKSATPLTSDNFLGHFLYAMNSSAVRGTVINGKVLMKDRELIGIDEEKIAFESRKAAEKFWKKI